MNENQTELSDEQLMESFRLGDPDAFDVLYRRHSARVFGYLRKRVLNEQLAQDIFQDTFLKVHRYRARYDCTQPFAGWLFTLCRNSMIDAIRSQGRMIFDSIDNLPDQSYDQIDNPDHVSIELLTQCLTAREQEVIRMRYEQDLSFSGIAANLGLSLTNVRKIASRAIKRLRGGDQ